MSTDLEEEVFNAGKILESKVHERKLIIIELKKHISDLTEENITCKKNGKNHTERKKIKDDLTILISNETCMLTPIEMLRWKTNFMKENWVS
ncbi:hypothetical protein JTB14_001549 [Gonioctena quinquepunctata]|nr:hypothetical protein JTB14_001549 [Gonioctena quinquepunctata]